MLVDIRSDAASLMKRPIFIGSLILTFAALATIGAATAFAVCVPTAYSVTASAPPPIANWTTTVGVWQPSGGFPGCSSGDTASDTNFSPTTLIINSSIPNPIVGLNLACNGCVIEVQSGGTLRLAGSGSIGSGATLRVNGGTLTIESGGTLNFQSGSTFDFSSGIVEIQTGGDVTLPPSTSTISGLGYLQLTGGALHIPSGGVLSLSSSGQLDLMAGSIDGSGTINNAGVVNMSGSGTVSIATTLNNTSGGFGVQVQSGTLSLSGGGTSDAPFTIYGGGTVDFPSGSYSMGAAGTVSGPGTLSISGGTLSIGGVTSPGGFVMTAGNLTGPGFLDVTSSMTWSGGMISGSGGTQLAGGATATFDAANGDIILSGRSFDDYGTVNYTATTNDLYLQSNATFTVYGTFDIVNDASIESGITTNYFLVKPNGQLYKSGATGTSIIQPNFSNDATVAVYSGTLSIQGAGGTSNGSFSVSSGATLQFAASTIDLTASSAISADGTIDFNAGATTVGGFYDVAGTTKLTGGTLYANSDSDTYDFVFDSGYLSLGASFNMHHTGTWSGGTIGTCGCGDSFYVDSGATLTIDSALDNTSLNGAEIINAGTIHYTATSNALYLSNNADIDNQGTFEIESDQPINVPIIIIGDGNRVSQSSPAVAKQPRHHLRPQPLSVSFPTIFNSGTFEKLSGTGTTFITPNMQNSGIVNAKAGTMAFNNAYIQTAGSTNLLGGNITMTNQALALNGGDLTGAGTLTGDLTNDGGNVAPGTGTTPGTINVTGNYSQSGTSTPSTLSIDIAGASSYDVLAVAGTATIADNFVAALVNGYTPANGATFNVLTGNPLTGTFSSQTLPTFASTHGSFTPSYSPTAFTLTAVVTPLQADLSIGMTGPATVNAGAALSYVVTVSNAAGDTTSGTITVINTLPAGVTGASATGSGWSCGAPSGGSITCTTTATLAAGNSLPSITVSMTAPSAGGSISNSATVASPISDPNGANQTASVPTTVVAQANLKITKTGPGGVTAGQNVTYTITVTNNGPSSAANVSVTDPQPANLTWVSNSGGCTANFPCNLGTMTSGQIVTITATYSTSPSFSGNVTNTASVSATTADPDGSDNSASATTNVGAQANLNITKSGPTSTQTGQNVVYTISVNNAGPSPATGVVVSDTTPVGLAFQSNSGACTTGFPCNLGTLNAGQTVTITSTYSVPGNYSGASISNTASVTSNVNDPSLSDNSSTATTTVAQQADVGILKSGPSTAGLGSNVAYTIVVSNSGPSAAAAVVVSDNTPAGLTFVSNSGACTNPFPCNLGTLNAGQSATITATYNVPNGFTGTSFTNTASVTSGATDPNSANSSSSVTTTIGTSADLSITKSGPASLAPGQNIVYTIAVTNSGPSTATGVVVTDPTPSGLTFVSNSGACTSPFPCNLGTLNSGQTATITATFNVPAGYGSSSIVNTASVSSSVTDSNPPNNSATAVTSTTQQADVSITKSGPTSVTAGQNIVYTIVVSNAGPLTANNVFVDDPTPAGLTFVSNSGGCTTSFPCAVGTLASGQSATITSTFNVPVGFTGASVTNTATVSNSSFDGNSANNSASATTTIGTAGADVGIKKSGPGEGFTNTLVDFTLIVFNNGPATASNIVVSDPTPSGLQLQSVSGACSSLPCTIASLASGGVTSATVRYRITSGPGTSITNTASVTSGGDNNSANNSGQATLTVLSPAVCPSQPPQILSPAAGAAQSSPVTLAWTSVANATSYTVTINGVSASTTNSTSMTISLPSGSYNWSVRANFTGACQSLTSTSTFVVCNDFTAPVPSVVGESTTGQTYKVEWTSVENAVTYELQESTDAAFTAPASFIVNDTGKSFTKVASSATPYFYRVRAVSTCNQSPFSQVISVVVIPIPPAEEVGGGINLPNGSTTPVTFQIFIPGLPGGPVAFIATVDKPWLSVIPVSGIVPPEGTKLTITADPTTLTNGTWNGTVIVAYITPGAGKIAPDAVSTVSVPVSVNLVTPVSPGKYQGPTANALVIPSVGHLAGIDSHWRSDIRVANVASAPSKFLLTFNPGNGDLTAIKQTTITIDSGGTTALDDIVRNWFGIGSLGDSSNGMLVVQALDASGKPLSGRVSQDTNVSKTTLVTSRTYNLPTTAKSNGTLGQFVPATAFGNFIGKSGAASSILSLQQIAQTDSYRTNLGVLEASGKPVSLNIGVFQGDGTKVLDVPLSLAGGEQKQLNSFLAQKNISLTNGRIEVQVLAGEGRVNAYASVIDSLSGDPLLVSGVPLGGLGSSRFIVPAVADLNGGSGSWRSDLRVFNSGAAPQNATLTFFPNNNPSASMSQNVTINPGEVKAVDNIVQSLFGATNVAGALHVATNTVAPLVVTSRTYDQTSKGTLGQFIPAVTQADAVGSGERALNILQVEDSAHYRTNLGVAEVTGKPATVEVSVVLPDSKISPHIQFTLGAYESTQFPIISSLGLGATYNARVSVKVLDGSGKITAYGSVVDMTTQAPTFIPAQ